MEITAENRRDIPSIDRLMREVGAVDLPRPQVLAIVRTQADRCRDGHVTVSDLLPAIRAALKANTSKRSQPVINASGIIIHTNLGRSVLAQEAIDAIGEAAANYTNLEFDLETGSRGSRGSALEDRLAILSKAPAATVVNNCAAALVLCVNYYTRHAPRTEVVISRGELVQIGGGFRIPEILESAGATLREVGTTNRTTTDDYARALSDRTAMILKVHHSNFTMNGFVESATLQQLAPLARAAAIPLVHDLGSGAILGTAGEPTPADSINAGADLVLFSGDKLMGGPQAGVIVGAAAAVRAIKTDPLFRAMRCDKLQLAALSATVDLYLHGRADRLPIQRMINVSIDELRSRAAAIVASLPNAPVTVAEGVSRIGGGAAPDATIASIVLKIATPDADALARSLRQASTPVIAYIESAHVLLDLRTIFPSQDATLTEIIRNALPV